MATLGKNPFAKTGKKSGVRPDINVTPLVDVVLVLLIIFMVVLPAVQDAKSIELVAVDAADDAAADGEEPVSLTISLEGETPVYTLVDVDLPRDAIVQAAVDKWNESPDLPLLLRVDASVKHKVVRDMVKDLRDAGLGAVNFAVSGQQEEWSDDAQPAGEVE
ncbi:MAG: ExbD/TolR family protein [Nannocystaceae bacterium]